MTFEEDIKRLNRRLTKLRNEFNKFSTAVCEWKRRDREDIDKLLRKGGVK